MPHGCAPGCTAQLQRYAARGTAGTGQVRVQPARSKPSARAFRVLARVQTEHHSCWFGARVQSQGDRPAKMRTPDEVYHDYHARKNGILSALTTDVDAFFAACDPASENLCLYGNPDESWVCNLQPCTCCCCWPQQQPEPRMIRRRWRCQRRRCRRRPRSRPWALTLLGTGW